MLRFWCCLLLLGIYISANAQDTIDLPDVTITALRLPKSIATEVIDSNVLSIMPTNTIAEVLQQQSNIFVKSYGAGSIATTSIRGGSASHTAVLWNGFPIQNIMLGQVDFSTLPSFLFDQVTVELGGNSPAWGSAAIGGVIKLGNDLEQKNEIELSNTIGNFGLLANRLKAQYAHKRWRTALKVWYQQAENDFTYSLQGTDETRRQTHAEVKHWGILQQNQFQLNQHTQLSWNNWYQKNDRQIPPTTTQNESTATQLDESFRTTLSLQHHKNAHTLLARTALFWDRLDYFSPGVDSQSETWNSRTEIEGKWSSNRWGSINYGISLSYLEANANAYEANPSQWRSAVFLEHLIRWAKLSVQTNLRQELADQSVIPIMPALLIAYNLQDQWMIKGRVARNFRLPTFNDLYWPIGGNPSLLPETGWSEELSVGTRLQKWTGSLTVFNRNLKNRILWQLDDRNFYWTPVNLEAVWSRGIEARLQYERAFGNLYFSGKLGYDYVRSTIETAKNPKLIGKQLIYTPEHQFTTTFQLTYKQFQLHYNQQYTGQVLIQAIRQEYLPSYQVGNLALKYRWQIQPLTGDVLFRINNLWDTNYRVIERRPMPGRNYELTISLGLVRPAQNSLKQEVTF